MGGNFLNIILFIMVSMTTATIITVDDNGPADFSMIQDGIDAAVDGRNNS